MLGFVSFSKSADLSHLKSAVLSRFRNARFCLVFEIGGFVSFKIGCFVSFSKSADLSHLKSAVLSRFRNRRFCLI